MGWTSKRFTKSTHTSFSEENLKEFIRDEYYNDYEQSMVHFVRNYNDEHELYMILRNRRGDIFICATLIYIKDNEIYWKDISESEGPRIANCAKEFFKFVPVPNDYAKEWREECIKNDVKLNRILV